MVHGGLGTNNLTLLNVLESVTHDYGESFRHLGFRRICFPPEIQDTVA